MKQKLAKQKFTKQNLTKRAVIKQTAAGFLTAAAALALLSGCASQSRTTDVIKDGRTQIDFWYSGGKTAAGVMEDIIRDFNQSQDEYQVTGIQQADYDETYMKLQAGIAGKTAADVALLDSDKSRSLMEKKLLVPIDAYLEKSAALDSEDLLPVFYSQCRLADGTVYAIPAYGTTQVLYYNRSLFEKAGIEAASIGTWQDLAAAAKTIKDTAGDGVYGWEPMWGPDNLIDMALSNGGSLISEDGKTVLINTEPWTESWEAVRNWIHEEKTMRIHYGGQGWEYWYATMDDVLADKAGGYTGSSGDQADLDFSKVAAMEQPGFGQNPSAPVARVLQLVMVETGKDKTKDGVFRFMEYFANPAVQARWSMATGYIPVCRSAMEQEDYKAYTTENPQALVPFTQAMHASPDPIDPTGGKIFDALEIAADQVEIENIPAAQALDEAYETAQKALDEVNGKQ